MQIENKWLYFLEGYGGLHCWKWGGVEIPEWANPSYLVIHTA